MDLVGQLATGIAHDFNNVLVSALGFAQLAQKTIKAQAKSLGICAYLEKPIDQIQLLQLISESLSRDT